MSRSPYAIRKGFEYQDLFCLCSLLELLDTESLDLEFDIESETVDHVDDLVVYTGPESAVGLQVKFHVDQEYAESFETLTKKKTKGSRSLLEKLYAGWVSLRTNGFDRARIEFVSSNPAERGRYKLGPAIDTATGRFRDKFYSHADYSKWLNTFKSLLSVDDTELKEFLDSLEWKLSFESIEGLRRKASHQLKRLHLPFDDDAVSRLLVLVGELANSEKKRMSLRSLVELLWKNSRFRDAVEQRFSTIDFGTSQQRRANEVRIAVVSIDSIPAFVGRKYACLEEPIPFSDYHTAVTASDKEGLLDQNRTSWKSEYISWTAQRIDSLLNSLTTKQFDILVFPRLSLPLGVAATIADWARERNISCVLGGHSLSQSQRERDLYQSSLNIALTASEMEATSDADAVVDCITRHNRAGRVVMAQMDSPFSKTERLLGTPTSVLIETNDGWLSVLVVPSQSAAKQYASNGAGRNELAIVSTGVHISETLEALSAAGDVSGMPVVYASNSVNTRPGCGIINEGVNVRHDDGWEGIQFFTVQYDRTHSGWTASTETNECIPLVYFPDDKFLDSSNFQDLRGLSASRSEAIARVQHGIADQIVMCDSEPPAEFFFRRSKEAEAAIRQKLPQASPAQLEAFSKTLVLLSSESEALRRKALLPPQFSPPPQKLLPQRVSRFFNRSKEKSQIGQFLSVQSDKVILLLYGPPGVGKRELLLESQRVTPQPNSWVRFRCTPQSRLQELFAQLLARLGQTVEVSQAADTQVFSRIVNAARNQSASVIVFEDAHFLPIFRDHQDHNQFLAFLSYICSPNHSNPRVIFISNHKGHLQFSGSHRMEVFHLQGLEEEYVTEIIQEHLLATSTKYEPPSVDEMRTLSTRIYGHPFLAKLAAVVLEESSIDEVIEKLYSRVETKEFILGRLLNGITITERERAFLHFAALIRIPVSSDAFTHFGGSAVLALLEDLIDRCLMIVEDGLYRLHPILCEYYQSSLREDDGVKNLHHNAHSYFDSISKKRRLTVEEQTELVYHGVSSGKSIDLADLQMFAGSIRTALDEAVRNRDWVAVENAARQLNTIWPYDVTGQIGMALALDNTGRRHDAEKFLASVENVTAESLWIALEFVKSLIRRRDFYGAERNLAAIQQRYGNDPKVILVQAQLFERQGQTIKGIECCEAVLSQANVKESDAFRAALHLRDCHRLDVLIKHLSTLYENGIRNEGLLRMFALAMVLGDFEPAEGLQVLSDLWNASPHDGFVVADYASALISMNRMRDAELVLERGLGDVPKRSQGYRAVLETFAWLYERQEQFSKAFERYRTAIGIAPMHLHLYRSFARCLLASASSYRTSGVSPQEDACISEAKQILEKLLQMAPLDEWAVDALNRAEQRIY